ncbi:hypothetical protein LBMAG42_55620 [Deltaproteobacteria bacterium]|nr:hypothetical protein LBMAG42_55620 [Deltaproteobacteria bacterium]
MSLALLLPLALTACGNTADTTPNADAISDDAAANIEYADESETSDNEDAIASFIDGPNLDNDVALYLNDNALHGEFTLQKDADGWHLYPDRMEIAMDDDGGEPAEDADDGSAWATSYWYDYTSGSSTSTSCSGSLYLLDDVTYSSATAGLYYTGGANQVQVLGSWSGCQSSGGSLVVAQTVSGTSLSVSIGAPSGVSVTTSSSTKFQWTDTVTPSSRKASLDACFSGIDGFVTGRVTTASLSYYVTSSSKKVLSVSKTSYYWRDSWASGPTC